MEKIRCLELLPDDELYKELEGRYMAEKERLKAIALHNDLDAIAEIKKNMDKTPDSDFESVVGSEYEMMEELLRYQNVDDFFEARAEYMAAAVLAGVEPYEYVYEENDIDELLDDIIDTTAILDETSVEKMCTEYISECTINAAKEYGLIVAGKTYEGRRKEICRMIFAGKDINLKVANMPGKFIAESDTDNEDLFEKACGYIADYFGSNHIVLKRETYKA